MTYNEIYKKIFFERTKLLYPQKNNLIIVAGSCKAMQNPNYYILLYQANPNLILN